MNISFRVALSTVAFAALTGACNGGSVLAPKYQPQIVNAANVAFSFQATGLQDITDVVSYNWSASSGSVIIHPATNTTSGTITLTIKDAVGGVIYSGTVPASGDITPPTGVGGSWWITVALTNYTGTINFAVQMQ
jgi:hypothetical protein